jgi:steroid delta-isomerase-like uncharacterized protein
MTPEQMDEVVEAHIGAESTGDTAAAVAVYTPDVEHDVVGAPGGPLRGPQAAKERYDRLLEEMQQESLTRTRSYYGDDFCAVEHACTCTVTGHLAGVPGEGRRVTFRMLHIFEFRDGRISRENVWMDMATVMAQLAPATAGAH